MNKFRPIFAVFLLLALLCGCAAPREVTTVSLPDAQPDTAADTPSTTPQAEPTSSDSHLEYQTFPLPAPLLSATALTVLGDVILVGGFTEDGLALARTTARRRGRGAAAAGRRGISLRAWFRQ